MLQACDLSRDQMPALYEGSEITGALLPEVAKAWGYLLIPYSYNHIKTLLIMKKSFFLPRVIF